MKIFGNLFKKKVEDENQMVETLIKRFNSRQDKLWNNLDTDEKEFYISCYRDCINKPNEFNKGQKHLMSYVFGDHNLEFNPETWEDMKKLFPGEYPVDFKLKKLIEFGYGGEITKDEWMDYHREKYGFFNYKGKVEVVMTNGGCRDERKEVYFHTYLQRCQFASHPENMELLKEYLNIK